MAREPPSRFGERLNLALKTINLSPAALGASVGLDKSVVLRWLAGKVRPGDHNLTRIAIQIARHRPGFTTLALDGPDEDFRRALDLPTAGAAWAAPQALAAESSILPIPYDLVNTSRTDVGRRGTNTSGPTMSTTGPLPSRVGSRGLPCCFALRPG